MSNSRSADKTKELFKAIGKIKVSKHIKRSSLSMENDKKIENTYNYRTQSRSFLKGSVISQKS